LKCLKTSAGIVMDRRKQMRRAGNFILGIVAGGLAILCVVSLILAFLVTRPIAQPPREAPPAAGDIVVSLDEAYLTQMATESIQSEEAPINRIAVDVLPGGKLDVILEASVKVVGLELTPAVKTTGFLEVSGGQLRFTLQRIQVGGIGVPLSSLPGRLREPVQALETDFSQQINDSLSQSGLVPVSVTSDGASITVTFKGQ
jgi:hypothetical protein